MTCLGFNAQSLFSLIDAALLGSAYLVNRHLMGMDETEKKENNHHNACIASRAAKVGGCNEAGGGPTSPEKKQEKKRWAAPKIWGINDGLRDVRT